MKTYALIQYGIVSEIFLPIFYDVEAPDWVDGDPSRIGQEIPITERFTAEFIANMVEITDVTPVPQAGWSYVDGVFSPPNNQPTNEALAATARQQRDYLLRSVYDAGISMAQRALRLAQDPAETDYAEGKIAELDAYAEALTGVPDQPGFPQTIVWPEAPVK